MRSFVTSPCADVDAYQMGHFKMIPPGMENFQCSQVVYRKPMFDNDNRLVSAGLRLFIELEMNKPITKEDIDETDDLMKDFHAPNVPYPWPKQMFETIVDKYGGIMPIVISGLMDGQTHYVGEPCVQVWTDEPGMGELVGWIESTMLPYLWNMSVVATRGRKRRERMIQTYMQAYPSLTHQKCADMCAYNFHDFGRRGAANSQLTGIAHLMNWLGTDCIDSVLVAVNKLNGGKKFGACSVAAAAHRTITPWPKEEQAYAKMIDEFGNGIFSVVADSYSYENGMKMLAKYASIVKEKGGYMVGRPDSGNPVDCILLGLQIFEEAFGSTKTETGLRRLNNSGIIQGDGVSDENLFDEIYPAMFEAGWCPSNLAIGMGQHNHKALRSDVEAAYKTCLVGTHDGFRSVMKGSESLFKRSIPGPVSLCCNNSNGYRVAPININQLKSGYTDSLKVQYDGREKKLSVEKESFDCTRNRIFRSWNEHCKDPGDTFMPRIREEQEFYMKTIGKAQE